MEQNVKPQRIDAADRALVLIQAFVDRGSLSVTETASVLEVAASTAHRMLATFCYRGFAVQGPQRRYYPGPSFPGYGLREHGDAHLTQLLRPFLEDLYGQVGETVHLLVLRGSDVHLIDGIESERSLRVGLRTGTRGPVHTSSGGKAMLADLPWSAVEALFPNGLRPWPRAKLRDLDSLRKHLAQVRRQGYGLNAEESEPGVTTLGASIRDSDGRPLAAMTVAVPTARFTDALAARNLKALIGTCTAAGRTVAGLR